VFSGVRRFLLSAQRSKEASGFPAQRQKEQRKEEREAGTKSSESRLALPHPGKTALPQQGRRACSTSAALPGRSSSSQTPAPARPHSWPSTLCHTAPQHPGTRSRGSPVTQACFTQGIACSPVTLPATGDFARHKHVRGLELRPRAGAPAPAVKSFYC